MESSLPLHVCQVERSALIKNRLHTFLHGAALTTLIYYRATNLHFLAINKHISIIFPHILVFASELMLSFFWLLDQAYRWRPVSRSVFPERLPGDDKLPSIDVFICTSDPSKEPSVVVMNAVISAMALDYPPEKLHVYLSDDGGSSVTLFAMKEAWKFGRLWLPFCRKYGIKTRCPQAYFAEDQESQSDFDLTELMSEKGEVERQYVLFKNQVQNFKENSSTITSKNHPPKIEFIKDAAADGEDRADIPLLVYVSREKRPSQPHNFKAGALNVLFRVSAMISNSPYILVLDCDFYSNDPTSARQAMCFHLDRNISPSLAYVQFPQKFHNLSDNDIYDSELRFFFKSRWRGFDGLKGPVVSGTCFYIKRKALCGALFQKDDIDLFQLRETFGPSDEFIQSLYQTKPNDFSSLLPILETLVSCDYEKHSLWGKQVGFRYFSVVEDYFTGFILQCEGWSSVYLEPTRPAFLGSATISLGETLVQYTRWRAGLAEVALSKYSPLLYGPPRMSILQSLCFAYLAYIPFYFLPCWCLATIPQLCLLRDIPLYPMVSSSFSTVFVFLFLSSCLKGIDDVFYSGHSIWTWVYEQRMWMIKSITCNFYGSLNALMEKIGLAEASFLPTNKANDEEQIKLYQLGKFDLQVSRMFISPICTLVILNSASLLIGLVKMICNRNYDEMLLQVFVLLFIVAIQYPVIEGLIIRKDKGRVPWSATVESAFLALIILALEYLIPM